MLTKYKNTNNCVSNEPKMQPKLAFSLISKPGTDKRLLDVILPIPFSKATAN